MNRWYLKGNSRRFYRIDMPLKTFIVPKTSIKNAEIYATGINYFPPSVVQKLNIAKHNTLEWTQQVQEHKEILRQLFDEAIHCIDFFGTCVERLSLGKDPRSNLDYWASIKELQKGFQKIGPLKSKAPKTYQYFKLIEEKYLYFLNSLVKAIETSTPENFVADTKIPRTFRVDEILAKMNDEKFARIPLVQAIISLGDLITLYTDVYRHITDDNTLKQFPDRWSVLQTNVSASGVAVQLNKRFKQYDKLDVYFFLPSIKKTIHFDGLVVDVRTNQDQTQERIAINFEFPDGKNQIALQNEIQKYEIDECFELEFSL